MITIDTRPYKRKASGPPAPPPKYCPHPECCCFSSPQGRWFLYRGSRVNSRHGLVWFYFCRSCQRSFSSTSFFVSYYEKVSLDYGRILSFAREGISLSRWAFLVGTTPGTLKLRLCKISWLMLKELSELCLPAASVLLFRVHRLQQRGERGYRVLRDLILLALSLLKDLRTSPLPSNRPFLFSLANRTKNLFWDLRNLCCQYRYLLSKDTFYYTRYQWE